MKQLQRIEYHTKNIHPLLNEIEQLYSITSTKEWSNEGLIQPTLDTSLQNILDVFEERAGIKYPVSLKDKHYDSIDITGIPSNSVVVCFSGGKDCVATAIHYKELGYNVYLYHLKGFKWAYPVDYKYAQAVADYLELPLHIEQVKIVGRHQWEIDHPLSKMVMINRALSYAISNKLAYKVATGDFLTSTLDENPFEINASDTIDMNRLYEDAIRTVLPEFELCIVNYNHYTAFDLINERKDKELLKRIISCANIHKWRAYWHDRTEKKYNIKLLPNRCGLCYKCCSEYIYFCDHDMLEFNEQYYKYCLSRLLKLWKTEFTKPLPTNIQDFWDSWILYDIEKSKLYPEILEYNIRGANIRYV